MYVGGYPYGHEDNSDPFAALDALEEMVAQGFASPVESVVDGYFHRGSNPLDPKRHCCADMLDQVHHELQASETPQPSTSPLRFGGSETSADACVGGQSGTRGPNGASHFEMSRSPAPQRTLAPDCSWGDCEDLMKDDFIREDDDRLRALYGQELQLRSVPNASRFEHGEVSLDRGFGDNDLDDLVGELLADSPMHGEDSYQLIHTFHCVGCDCQVMQIDDNVWEEDLDYLFFRNHYPVFEALKCGLMRQPAWAAFCCKCSWTSVPAHTDLYDVAEGFRWRVLSP